MPSISISTASNSTAPPAAIEPSTAIVPVIAVCTVTSPLVLKIPSKLTSVAASISNDSIVSAAARLTAVPADIVRLPPPVKAPRVTAPVTRSPVVSMLTGVSATMLVEPTPLKSTGPSTIISPVRWAVLESRSNNVGLAPAPAPTVDNAMSPLTIFALRLMFWAPLKSPLNSSEPFVDVIPPTAIAVTVTSSLKVISPAEVSVIAPLISTEPLYSVLPEVLSCVAVIVV